MMMFGLPLAAALERKARERKSGNCSRWRDATRRGGWVSNYLGDFPRRKSAKWRACESPKKIEQDPSGECQKSEYLTLLNTFENATTRDRRSPNELYLE
jgi:hypothetical protein